MVYWRIRHKETGLYYCHVSGAYAYRTNISKVGALYKTATPRAKILSTQKEYNISQRQLCLTKKDYRIDEYWNSNFIENNYEDDWYIEKLEISEGIKIIYDDIPRMDSIDDVVRENKHEFEIISFAKMPCYYGRTAVILERLYDGENYVMTVSDLLESYIEPVDNNSDIE